MKILLTLIVTLMGSAWSSAATSNREQRRPEWKITACKKACIPAHDAKVLACRTVQTKEGEICEKNADRQRAECEQSCLPVKRKRLNN